MAARDLFREFCSKSTIHGVRYFTEKRCHWSERIWWITVFSVSVCICGVSIQNIWQKWTETPIVMGLPEKDLTVSEVPFPMVTVCPATKFYKQKFDATAVFHSLRKQSAANLSDTDLIKMKAMTHVCRFPEFRNVNFGDEFTNESIYSVIQSIAFSLNDTIKECTWKNKLTPCAELFAPVMTEEGICYTYNALNSHELYTEQMTSDMMTLKTNSNITNWSLENGYMQKRSQNNYPARVFNARPGTALSFTALIHERDSEYMCSGFQGFQVFLQLPGETIEMAGKSVRVPISEGTDILVRPTYVGTSKRLRSYSANRRRCFFQSERQLRFFKTYTRQNCEAECLANFTLQECGCMKFSMPREDGIRICGTSKLECYRNAKEKLFGEDEIDGLDDENARDFREECDCLSSCSSIWYTIETDRASFDWEAYALSHNYPSYYSKFKPAYVNIYYKDLRLDTFKRSEKYTITNIISMWGGLLGLFMGVSVLSVAELIYYSTFRLYWTLCEHKRKDIVEPFIKDTLPTQHTQIQYFYSNRAKSIAQALSEISSQ